MCVCVYSRSSWHPHAAHSVTEAMRPEGGHIILLDLHLVALEVRELIQADLVLHAVLQGGNEAWGSIRVFMLHQLQLNDFHSCFVFFL